MKKKLICITALIISIILYLLDMNNKTNIGYFEDGKHYIYWYEGLKYLVMIVVAIGISIYTSDEKGFIIPDEMDSKTSKMKVIFAAIGLFLGIVLLSFIHTDLLIGVDLFWTSITYITVWLILIESLIFSRSTIASMATIILEGM